MKDKGSKKSPEATHVPLGYNIQTYASEGPTLKVTASGT